jgi:hypothetical protein
MLNTLTKEELEDNSNRKGNRGTNWFQRKSAYLDAISKTAMATRHYPEFNDAVILKKKFEVESIIAKYLGSNIYSNARDNGGKDMFWAIKSGTGVVGYLPKETRQKMVRELKKYSTIAGWPMSGKYNDKQEILVHIPV